MKKKKQKEPIVLDGPEDLIPTPERLENKQDSPVASPERAVRSPNPRTITVEDKKLFKLTKGEKYK